MILYLFLVPFSDPYVKKCYQGSADFVLSGKVFVKKPSVGAIWNFSTGTGLL
jgi:hypothetical protein